jgi:hypothetical protein
MQVTKDMGAGWRKRVTKLAPRKDGQPAATHAVVFEKWSSKTRPEGFHIEKMRGTAAEAQAAMEGK